MTPKRLSAQRPRLCRRPGALGKRFFERMSVRNQNSMKRFDTQRQEIYV